MLVFFEIGRGCGVATNSLSDILLDHVLNHASILAWLVSKPTGGTIDRIHHRRTLDENVLGTSLVIHSQHDEVAKPARIMRQRKPNKVCDDIPSNPTSSIVLYTVLPTNRIAIKQALVPRPAETSMCGPTIPQALPNCGRYPWWNESPEIFEHCGSPHGGDPRKTTQVPSGQLLPDSADGVRQIIAAYGLTNYLLSVLPDFA